MTHHSTPRSSIGGPFTLIIAIFLFGLFIVLVARHDLTPGRNNPAPLIPDFSIPMARVRQPMPFRIVSFHRGRADKNLIKLAAQLGFNGVQFQIEGSNEQGIADFAARDSREHLVDYCHSLGMKVTVWVHELSDLPGPWMPEYLGPETADNDALFDYLGQRYEWILAKAIPNVDGLALTVVETQIRATKPPMLLRLCDLISKKCAEHNKSFMLRTFVWHPEELEGVMGAVKKLPPDTVIMSKSVPQDWQMRGAHPMEIGAVGGRPQIIEFDVEGEYFLHNAVANCMPELLKKQFDYAVSKGAQGICVRVDRADDSVLFQPSEVNLWALGMLASGASKSVDDIWNRWATYRYGSQAAPVIIRALKPTEEVVAEIVSIGPFTFGDTRRFPPLPDEEVFTQNWQNWQWDKDYLPAYHEAETGDAAFIQKVAQQKVGAMRIADACLKDLEAARPLLNRIDWEILYTKLLTNKTQLAFRSPMALAALDIAPQRMPPHGLRGEAHLDKIRQYIAEVRAIVSPRYPLPIEVDYAGRRWQLGVPAEVNRNILLFWAYDTELLIDGKRCAAPQAHRTRPRPSASVSLTTSEIDSTRRPSRRATWAPCSKRRVTFVENCVAVKRAHIARGNGR